MPRISSFYGITIFMYWNEGVHARAHFHARYAGHGASVDLDGNLIAGSISPRALSLVAEWAHLRPWQLPRFPPSPSFESRALPFGVAQASARFSGEAEARAVPPE